MPLVHVTITLRLFTNISTGGLYQMQDRRAHLLETSETKDCCEHPWALSDQGFSIN